jgi:hypothetical protein
LRGQDLNLRPSGYEPDELPGCSTPRHVGDDFVVRVFLADGQNEIATFWVATADFCEAKYRIRDAPLWGFCFRRPSSLATTNGRFEGGLFVSGRCRHFVIV